MTEFVRRASGVISRSNSWRFVRWALQRMRLCPPALSQRGPWTSEQGPQGSGHVTECAGVFHDKVRLFQPWTSGAASTTAKLLSLSPPSQIHTTTRSLCGPNCAECRDLQTRRKTGARPRQVTGTYAAQGALPVRWCCPLRNTQGCCRWNGMKNCCRTDGRPCCCETGECCDSNGPGNDSGRDLPTTARAEVAGS